MTLVTDTVMIGIIKLWATYVISRQSDESTLMPTQPKRLRLH
jgi:hypothetical protein